jgi:hypothetical protein
MPGLYPAYPPFDRLTALSNVEEAVRPYKKFNLFYIGADLRADRYKSYFM